MFLMSGASEERGSTLCGNGGEYEPLFEHKKTAYSFLSHTRAGVKMGSNGMPDSR